MEQKFILKTFLIALEELFYELSYSVSYNQPSPPPPSPLFPPSPPSIPLSELSYIAPKLPGSERIRRRLNASHTLHPQKIRAIGPAKQITSTHTLREKKTAMKAQNRRRKLQSFDNACMRDLENEGRKEGLMERRRYAK